MHDFVEVFSFNFHKEHIFFIEPYSQTELLMKKSMVLRTNLSTISRKPIHVKQLNLIHT